MSRLLFGLAVIAMAAAVSLQLVGYFWHRPPAYLHYFALLLNYAPKWVWLVPAVVSLVLLGNRRTGAKLFAIVCVLAVIWMQDIQLRGLLFPVQKSGSPLTVMTLNTGGVSSQSVSALVDRHAPDIVLLQEFQQQGIETIGGASWQRDCAAHLCIASRYPFTVIENYSRAAFSDWGSFAAAYEMEVNGQKLRVVNTHLETPRDALGGRPIVDINPEDVDNYSYEKHTELTILQTLMSMAAPTVLAGDLNTSVLDAAYRSHLGQFTNAVGHTAGGVNYTKYTRWHGVRIDHIVGNKRVTIHDAQTLSDSGGDHRAVLATMSFNAL